MSTIHPNINPEDIHFDKEKAWLLNAKERAAAFEFFKKNPEAIKFSKKLSRKTTGKILNKAGLSRSIIKININGNDQLFAIYKGGEQALGKGGEGILKIAQNLETGEFFALKKSLSPPSPVSVEITQAMNQFFGQQKRNKPASGKKDLVVHYALIKLLQGTTLTRALEKQNNLPKLELAIQAAEALFKMHQKGFLHLDFKLDNLMYNPDSGKLSLIDFGTSAKLKPGEPVLYRRFFEGSLGYAEPVSDLFENTISIDPQNLNDRFLVEKNKYAKDLLSDNSGLWEYFQEEKETLFRKGMPFSKQSDIYALGQVLDKDLDLGGEYEPPLQNYVDDFIQKMRSVNPENRGNIETCLFELSYIQFCRNNQLDPEKHKITHKELFDFASKFEFTNYKAAEIFYTEQQANPIEPGLLYDYLKNCGQQSKNPDLEDFQSFILNPKKEIATEIFSPKTSIALESEQKENKANKEIRKSQYETNKYPPTSSPESKAKKVLGRLRNCFLSIFSSDEKSSVTDTALKNPGQTSAKKNDPNL
ncbi:MAG: protein kinase domain-containing protein [Gammaproteobacteria bacterium]